MNSTTSRWMKILALPLAATLVMGACSSDDSDSSNGSGGEGSELSGTINISGSSTVEPISAVVAEAFADEEPDVIVNVDGPGTGDGFELFCNGETEISNASRPIKDEEIQACEDNGVEYIELKVAYDGITVMTSTENDAVECLSLEDLYALTSSEADGFNNWSDAQDLAAELGSDTDFPDAPLVITAPGTESGTYDTFVELVIDQVAKDQDRDNEGSRSDYQEAADDNVIIQNISTTPTSFGWVGYAFYEQNTDAVSSIAVDGGEGCVEPNDDTISDGSYPLSRALYIYVSTEAAERPEVEAFVDFYLESLNDFVAEGGYVTMPDDEVDEVTATWTNR